MHQTPAAVSIPRGFVQPEALRRREMGAEGWARGELEQPRSKAGRKELQSLLAWGAQQQDHSSQAGENKAAAAECCFYYLRKLKPV